jgi:hypothetical protein
MNVQKLDAEYVYNNCSQTHTVNVMKHLKEISILADTLAKEINSLNPLCATIGEGKRANMVFLAQKIQELTK